MKQTITIEVPEGKVAKQVTNEDGSIHFTFVNKEPIRSKSWEEFCMNHPDTRKDWFISNTGQIVPNSFDCLRIDGKCNNHLSTKEDAEGILALIQLTRLHDEWVGDWEPNYNNINEEKYQIIHVQEDIRIFTYTCRHSILDFPTKEMATEFLQCFHDLINKAKRFI